MTTGAGPAGGGTSVVRVPVADLCCLWAEAADSPMHIAFAGIFQGPPLREGGGVRLDLVRSSVAARLHRVPELRRVLQQTSLGEGGPVWVDAPSFDLEDHVVLPAPAQPLDEPGFLSWCAQRSLLPLPRTRPLWRMDVAALEDGSTGVLLVVHHVVADGLRAAALLARLLDGAPPEVARPLPWHPSPPPVRSALVVDNLRRRGTALRRAARGVARLPQRVRPLVGLAAGMRAPAPATPLTGPVGPVRRLAVVHRRVDVLKAAAHRQSATLNDVLLAAVTSGLRELLGTGGPVPAGLELRASVPVGAVGGRPGGMVLVPLPVGLAEPAARLQRIRDETAARKRHPDGGVAGIVSLPAWLARLGVAWARRTAGRQVNLYVTNVPGPPGPLHLAGARLLRAVPMAPLVAQVRLSVTALSYDGVLTVALLGNGCIDVARLAAGVAAGFDELGAHDSDSAAAGDRAAAGVAPS